MPQTTDEYVTLRDGEGTTMRSYVARPTDGAQHPGLIVFHVTFGLNPHIRGVTGRFGRKGLHCACAGAVPSDFARL
jgi:dienelactone hydrolase